MVSPLKITFVDFESWRCDQTSLYKVPEESRTHWRSNFILSSPFLHFTMSISVQSQGRTKYVLPKLKNARPLSIISWGNSGVLPKRHPIQVHILLTSVYAYITSSHHGMWVLMFIIEWIEFWCSLLSFKIIKTACLHDYDNILSAWTSQTQSLKTILKRSLTAPHETPCINSRMLDVINKGQCYRQISSDLNRRCSLFRVELRSIRNICRSVSTIFHMHVDVS
jgi:hypothetical protein